jgi:hypothetical protein
MRISNGINIHGITGTNVTVIAVALTQIKISVMALIRLGRIHTILV